MNIPDLEEPYLICILTKATKITRANNIDAFKFSHGFMLQIGFSFSMMKAFVDLYLHLWLYVLPIHTPLDFHPEKLAPFGTIPLLVNTLNNQDKKSSLIWRGKFVALEISSEFIRACHNMKIIVQTSGGGAYSLNEKN